LVLKRCRSAEKLFVVGEIAKLDIHGARRNHLVAVLVVSIERDLSDGGNESQAAEPSEVA
jgi:hypothetical protein